MSSQVCPICLQTNLKLQGHHIIPKEYAGPVDGPLLDVCATCHLNIHYTAETEYKGEQASYLLPAQRHRAHEYVETIKRAKQVFETAGGGENLKRKVMLMIPQKDLTRMHKRKSDKGFTSLEKYLLDLIYRDIRNL